MGGILLCKSRDVKIVYDADGVFNLGGIENGGVGRKKGYIYFSSCDFFIQLVLLDHEHRKARPSS